jgi:phage gp16-like protein
MQITQNFQKKKGGSFSTVLELTKNIQCRWVVALHFFTVEHDREGGGPIKLKVEEANIDGFLAAMERGHWKFMAPCTFHSSGTSQQVLYA